jgi:hypothetical protein
MRQRNCPSLFPNCGEAETTVGFVPVWLKRVGVRRILRVGQPGRVIPHPFGFVLAVIALAFTTGNLEFSNKQGNSYVDGRPRNVLPLNF